MVLSKTSQLTEKQFQSQIVQLAKLFGWMVYHTHDSRRSEPGFPDLILLRRDQFIVAELKVGKNKPTPDQHRWLNAFRNVQASVFVWTPNDWQEIQAAIA